MSWGTLVAGDLCLLLAWALIWWAREREEQALDDHMDSLAHKLHGWRGKGP